MSSQKKTAAQVLVAAAVAAALSGTAVAQAQLEEITVTARKRTESLQEVPLTVTAFTAETIQRQGIRSVQDVAKLTPGLSWDKGFAPQDTRPNIRGLPTTRGRPPIGILLDGIDMSSESIATAGGSSLMNMKLVDVERIEVVKGPQSALYGRVAFGGAINYISIKPNLEETEGNVFLDAATDSLYEVRGAVNLPLSDGRMALRLNGVYSDFDGFYDNEVSGERLGGWKTQGVAAALRFAPSDGVDFTLRMSYSDDEMEPRPSYYFGQAVAGRNQPLALPSSVVGARIGAAPGATTGGTVLPATIPYPLLGEARNGDRVLLSVDPATGADYVGSDMETFVASLVGEIELGVGTLSSWTGYTTSNALSRADADFYGAASTIVTRPTVGTGEPLPAAQVTDIYSEVKQISQELRLGTLSTEDRFRWAVGGLFWKEDYSSINTSVFISGFARNPPLAPAGWSAGREIALRGPLPGDLNFRNTEHTSAYLMADFKFNDQFSASAEARYSEEDFEYLFGRPIGLAINAGTGALVPFPGYGGTPFRPSNSSSFFAPKLNLNFKPNDDQLFYVTASKGVKPAGYLNVAVVLDPADAFYKPETLWNYEIGAKTEWLDGRLRVNAAYFHMIYEDRINQLLVPDLRSPQGTSTLVRNLGEAKVDGLELELTAALADGLTLNVGYTYLDPRFTDSEVPNTSALGVGGSGNCRLGTVGPLQVCFTNTNGNQLEQSAKHAVIASLDYRRPLANDWELATQLAAQYRSKRYTSPDNLIWLPAVTNVDAQVSLESEKYTVTLYGTNLFGYDKPISAQTYGDPFIALPVAPPVLAYTTYPADPRQVGVRASIRF
jgi:outer membrane receptor protein involved in Fe transport